jgi:hypothetical protein
VNGSAVKKDGGESIEDAERIGRPITVKNDENIELVRAFIQDNPQCTYDELEAYSSLSRGTLERIIHDCLGLRKVTSRYVPYLLSEQNRKDRVRICRENLENFESGSWRLYDVVTGDES